MCVFSHCNFRGGTTTVSVKIEITAQAAETAETVVASRSL